MMVREHNELLSIQFLLGAEEEGHPDHQTTEKPPPGFRQVIPTLLAKVSDRLFDHFGQETMKDLDKPAYRAGLTQIHQDLAVKAASSYTPPILEKKLPKKTRCTLAQLRSDTASHRTAIRTDWIPGCQTSAWSAGWGHTMWPTSLSAQASPRAWSRSACRHSPLEAAGFLGLEVGEEDSDRVVLV